MPIIEPEVNINSESKAEAEEILHGEIEVHPKAPPEGKMVMLKLTIPERPVSMTILPNMPMCCASWRCRVAIPRRKPANGWARTGP